MDILFILDLFLNFRVGFVHNVRVVMEPKAIFWRYVKGFFLIDLMSSIPYKWLTPEDSTAQTFVLIKCAR